MTATIVPCDHDTLGCRDRTPHDEHTKLGDGRPCCGWPPRCRVDQTLFVDTPDRQGNCLSACVATFLTIDLEAVPHFAEYLPDEGDSWWHLYIGFMAGHGLWPTELDDPSEAEPREVVFVCGPSERGALHQVLYRDGALWHDPHPSRAGLLAVTEVIAWRNVVHDHGARP
jgi:hypothetical protein